MNKILDDIHALERALKALELPIQVLGTSAENGTEVEIQYQLKGRYRTANNSVEESQTHRVKISISFGYPHLPPRCCAETPVFHPAFDDDAIQIQDFWPTSQSLTELVLYIGRLITGQVTTVDSAFDQEAEVWYSQNIISLPFDSTNLNFTRLELQEAADARIEKEAPPEVGVIPESPESLVLPELPRTQGAPTTPKESSKLLKKILIGSVVGLTLAGGLAGGAYFVLRGDTHALQTASRFIKSCEDRAEDQEYTRAEVACLKARDLLQGVHLKKSELSVMNARISAILDEENFVQGLKGKIRIDGKFIDRDDHELKIKLGKLRARTDSAHTNENYVDLVEAYKYATVLVQQSDNAEMQRLVPEFEKKQRYAEFQVALHEFQERLSLDKINTIAASQRVVEDALKRVSVEESGELRDQLEELKLLVMPYRLGVSITTAFQKKKWKDVQTLYTRFESLPGGPSFLLLDDGVTITSKYDQSKVFQLVSEGNHYYESSNWKRAESAYNSAIMLLIQLQDNNQNVSEAKQKIEKRYLQSRLNRLWVEAEVHMKRNELANARAVLRTAIDVFDQNQETLKSLSNFEQQFQKRYRSLAQVDKKSGPTLYIQSHFKAILLDSFGADADDYTIPVIQLAKTTATSKLYRVQYSPLQRLSTIHEFYYQYNTKTTTWSVVYTEN